MSARYFLVSLRPRVWAALTNVQVACESVAMTQTRKRREKWSTPTQTVAERIKGLRQRRGWTAAELADRCADKGLNGFNRSVLANLESGRRKYVSVDELLTLAYVLDVAPVHLLVPVEVDESVDEHRYLVCPDVFLPIPQARAWVRGDHAPSAVDPRIYHSEVPREDFVWAERLSRPTDQQIAERGERLEQRRALADKVLPPGRSRDRGQR